MSRMRTLVLFVFGLLCLAAVNAAEAGPQPTAADAGDMLVVGTTLAPPFAITAPDGNGYTGISIELWQALAAQLGIDYRYVQRTPKQLFAGLENGSLDIAVGALAATARREARIDFAYPFFSTGLAIAVTADGNAVWTVLSGLFSWQFAAAVLTLAALLLLAGALVWLFERCRNSEEFGGSVPHGLAEGFWWAAVTMTTVGYGDRSPRTLGGRIVGLIWMFAAMITVSSLTAAIATSLTVGQLQTTVHSAADLPGVRVATVQESAAADVLAERGIGFMTYADLHAALAALAQGDTDAVVYDAPLLNYAVMQGPADNVQVLAATFERHDYAFALPPGSGELREALDRALLRYLNTPAWTALRTQYLGAP